MTKPAYTFRTTVATSFVSLDVTHRVTPDAVRARTVSVTLTLWNDGSRWLSYREWTPTGGTKLLHRIENPTFAGDIQNGEEYLARLLPTAINAAKGAATVAAFG